MSTRIYRDKTPTTVDIASLPQGFVYGFNTHLKQSEGNDFGHVSQDTIGNTRAILISPTSPKPSIARKILEGYSSYASSLAAQAIKGGGKAGYELLSRGFQNLAGPNTHYVEVKVGAVTYKYAWNLRKQRQTLLQPEFTNLGIKKATANDELVFAPETHRPLRLYKRMSFTVAGGSGNTENRVSSFASSTKVDNPTGGWATLGGKNSRKVT